MDEKRVLSAGREAIVERKEKKKEIKNKHAYYKRNIDYIHIAYSNYIVLHTHTYGTSTYIAYT